MLVVPVVASGNAAVAKKVVDELYAWLVASSVLLGLSASVVGSSAKGAAAATSAAGASLDALMALFGAVSLLISAALLYSLSRILRGHALLPYPPYARLRGLGEEETIRLVKDAVSLYRGYRWYIALAGAILAATGAALAAIAVEESAGGEIAATLFRLVVAAIYLGYGVLDLHLERKTVLKRLAAARRLEAELSKFVE